MPEQQIWTRKKRGGEWGPWHRGDSRWLTLCGRRLPGVIAWGDDEPPADERRCDVCTRHAANGTSAPYRRRR